MGDQLLHTLDQNWVLALLTAGYLIATIFLVKHSAKQSKMIKQTLDFYARAEHDRYRPYVIFDLVYDEGIAYAKMRNVGILPALNIVVAITPELRWDSASNEVAFIAKGISFLAPNRELSEPFAPLKNLQDMPHLKFVGKVSYQDAKGTSYDEPFAIDLSYTITQSFMGKTTVEERLKEMEGTLERLTGVLSKPLLVRNIPEAEYQRQKEIRAREEAERRAKFKAAVAATEAKKLVASGSVAAGAAPENLVK